MSSVTHLTTQSNQAVSAANGSSTFQTLSFANSNGVSFSTGTQGIYASISPSGGGIAASIGGNSTSGGAGYSNITSGTLILKGGNNITLSQDGANITISGANVGGAQTGISGLSAGTTQMTSGTAVFSDSNGISFGVNGNTVTASHNGLTTAMASNRGTDFVQATAAFNGTNASGTIASNAISVSVAAQSVQPVAYSAANGSANFSTLKFVDTNGVSFSTSTDGIRATVKTDYLTSQSNQAFSASGGSSAFQTLNFANSNGITFSNSNGSVVASHNGLTTAMASNAGSLFLNTGTTGATNASITLQSNGLSVSVGNYITTARASTDAVGLNTALTAGPLAWTVNSSGISLNASSVAGTTSGFGGNLISGSMTHNTAGLNLSLSHPAWLTTAMQSGSQSQLWIMGNSSATIGGTNISGTVFSNGMSLSAGGGGGAAIKGSGTYTQATGTVEFANSNGITFGLSNNGTMTASHNGITSQTNQTVGLYALGNTTQNSSSTMDARTMSYNALGAMTMGFSNGSIQVSAPATSSMVGVGAITISTNGSTISISGGTVAASPMGMSAGTVSSTYGTVTFSNANSISFGLGTGASAGVITASYNDLDVAISAGASSISSGTVIFSNSNGVSFGLNGSTLTADARQILSTYEPYPALGLSTVLVGVPTATSAAVSVYPFVLNGYVSAGILNIPYSMAFLTNGTSSGQQTMGLAMGIYSRNASTLSSIASTSFSIRVTGNNSSYTINQPTSTAYSAYGATGATNSAGSNISSGYTGVKMVGFPVNTLLTPGNYWLAMIGTNSTSSINVGISMSHFGAAMGTFGSAGAPIGSFSSAYTSGQDPNGRWLVGQGSWTSAGSVTNLPASMAFASISAVGLTYPLMKFWST